MSTCVLSCGACKSVRQQAIAAGSCLAAAGHNLAAPAQEAPKTEEVAWAAGADVADKVQAPLEEAPAEGEAAPADGAAVAGSEPPEVRVLVNGLQKDAAAREAAAEKPEPVELHVEPVRTFFIFSGVYWLWGKCCASSTVFEAALITHMWTA